MLTIRESQLLEMRRSRLQPMIDRAVLHASTFLPEQSTELGGRLETRVRALIDLAMRAGIETEKDLFRFVNVGLVLGPSFPEAFAWAERILNRALSSTDKASLVVRVAKGALEDAAAYEAYQRSAAAEDDVV